MSQNDLLNDVISESPNRRSLLKKFGMATAAAGAVMVAGGVELKADPAAPTVVDVLQFALNLEYLESEFYTIALYGQTIDQYDGTGISGSGKSGPTMNGKKVNFSNNLVFTYSVAEQIGFDERAHVRLLRSALSAAGITPIAKPEINLNALGFGFGNEAEFLNLARIFEDIGVTAYGGAAGLSSVATSPYIGTAARILAAEAEHVANIRLQLARLGISSPKLDGVDIPPLPTTGGRYLSLDDNGLSAIRTPGQVLFLAYGMQAGVTSGGFFPMGVNGNLKTSTASA